LLIFGVWPCLAARLSRRVGGVPPARVPSFLAVGLFRLVSRTGELATGQLRQ